jgi:major type 1 subunit fimbrin (pilin)
MNMKPTLLATAIAVAGGVMALAPTARAADGTITINGRVTATTCVINGGGGGNETVTLPDTTVTPLGASGDTTGDTSFSIALTDCPGADTSVITYWSGSNINGTDGHLNNLGSAGNVEVQLLDGDDSTALDLSQSSGNQGVTSVSIPATGNPNAGAATLTYYARYYATGAASPGTVNTSVDYTLVYN